MPKYVYRRSEALDGLRDPKYFEAQKISDVYRHCISHYYLIEFIKLIVPEAKCDHFHDDLNLKEVNYNGYGDNSDEIDQMTVPMDDDITEMLEHRKAISFINLGPFTLRKLYRLAQTDRKACTDQLLKLLCDQSIINIFNYYTTSGAGDQSGTPGKEWFDDEIIEYQEPEFIKLP